MTGPIVSGRDPRFEKTLYAHVGQEGSWTLDYYLKHGGYETAKRVLKEKTPEEVIEEVKRSGLRGRGGAGFPTGVKWSFMPKDGKQHYLICNADESEPGSFKDRYILEDVPHLLLEGMILAGYAIRATVGYIYVRGEYRKAADRLEAAIREARTRGYLGENLFGSGFSFDVHVHRGAGAYICGEETALMNSLEAEAFAELFDGFSIGSNDLTQLALGLDRDSERVAWLFDERRETVKLLSAMLIEKAHAKGKKVGICGQAPSDYPEFAAFLVAKGIDSLSLNPDALLRTVKKVAEIEAALDSGA
ncbi:hypothetical protein CSW26_07520 [Thermus scotoductus]|nr:hypothetical protein CSW26_07520 [Thermus scotoductus]